MGAGPLSEPPHPHHRDERRRRRIGHDRAHDRHGPDRCTGAARRGRADAGRQRHVFEDQVALKPQAVAVQSPQGDWTYAQLGEQVARMSAWLRVQGVARGDRVAILSENRREFVLTLLAAAKVGAIVACMNWRQTAEELAHCITLVTPRIALVSPRYEQHVKLFGEVAC